MRQAALLAGAALAAVASLGVAAAAGPPAAAASVSRATATPIHHFVALMQENHTFDNYFGTYPGADGFPRNTCLPVDPKLGPTPCVRPFPLGHRAVVDLEHGRPTALRAFDGGKLDGFVSAQDSAHQPGRLAMGYYTGAQIPFSWNAAKNYVLFDHLFSSAMDASLLNHIYWVAAGPANDQPNAKTINGPQGLVANTIFDELESAGISWKFYVQNYQPSVNHWSAPTANFLNHENQIVWCPLLDIKRFVYDRTLASHIVPLSQYYQNLHDGTLPAVSFIVPSGDSEHPPGNIMAGQRFQRGLVTALMQSSAWDSSAFMVAYDDWGGWYDNVVPPKRDPYADGFRVPAYLISPYAKRGFVDHATLDFTSELKFIEDNWHVPALTALDATAGSIQGAFDFAQPPRPPKIISLSYSARPAPANHVRDAVLFSLYGGAVLAMVLAIALLAGRPWRRLRLRARRP